MNDPNTQEATQEKTVRKRHLSDLATGFDEWTANYDAADALWVKDWNNLAINDNKQLQIPHLNLIVSINSEENFHHAVFFAEEDDELFFSLHDEKGKALKILRVPKVKPNQKGQVRESHLAFEPEENLNFFDETLITFVRDIDEDEFMQFLTDFPIFFDKSSRFISNESYPIPGYIINTEFLFNFWKLIKKATPEQTEKLFSFAALNSKNLNTLALLWTFDSPEDIKKIDFYSELNEEYMAQLVISFTQMAEFADYVEESLKNKNKKKIYHLFIKKIFQTFKLAFDNFENPELPRELVRTAFQSIGNLFATVFGSELAINNEELEKVNAYLEKKANYDGSEKLFSGVIECLLLQKQPLGFLERVQLSLLFYKIMGPDLEGNASETTGDTEKEMEFLNKIFTAVAKDFPEDYSWLEAGCGSGRVLKNLYPMLKEAGIAPKLCLAVDRVDQDEDGNTLINIPDELEIPHQFFLNDLSEPTEGKILPDTITKPHIATAQWSVINDNPPLAQQKILSNLSRSLADGGILVLEFPTYEHYEKDVDEAGVLEKHFSINAVMTGDEEDDGGKKDENGKKEADITVSITRTGFLTMFAQNAGFELVQGDTMGIPELENGVWRYETDSVGQKRAFMVLRKVADPEVTIAELLDDDQKQT